MNYISLVGSRCYGLEIEGSDYDYVVVGEIHTPIDIKHCFLKTPERFLSEFLMQWEHPYSLMPFFSNEIDGDQNVVDFVVNNRERMILTYRKRLYNVYMKMAQDFLQVGSNKGRYFSKLSAYGLLWFETLYRYANGERFSDCFRPSDELKPFLIDLRQEKITKKSLDEKKKELLKNAESVEEFYLFDEDFDTQKDFKTEFLSMMKPKE